MIYIYNIKIMYDIIYTLPFFSLSVSADGETGVDEEGTGKKAKEI